MKNNPNRGGLKGDNWYIHIIHIPDYGTIQFIGEDSFNWSKGPCLIGDHQSIKQRCSNCGKHINEYDFVFVVFRVRSHIDYHFVSKLSLKIDAEDVFCSKEKLPQFMQWQMEEHKKTCGQPTANPIQP